ncbi:hypothetical protein AJ80_00268 [Polytolypa hystricis UAMH7299]|uniref:Ubiquitin 3 binding protein But2 C-terminal domain-containing protein n=1 Tax=Polytolypa hystricis (strain UAMH7299) TaxID=1447883 RepID=A0A2B7Z449_POLH7|nr:hypothetical protein AJ80_00268 [Polytolypa hystricis UAMH7299]
MKTLALTSILALCASALPSSGSQGNFARAIEVLDPSNTTCSATLKTGSFEFPHLIIPINSATPSVAPGTSYNGQVSSTVSSLFNFDIPYGDNNRTCNLIFIFPSEEQRPSSWYTYSGEGEVSFSLLKEPASMTTTFANAPDVDVEFGQAKLAPGHVYLVHKFECPGGQRLGVRMAGVGDVELNYFQDYTSPP